MYRTSRVLWTYVRFTFTMHAKQTLILYAAVARQPSRHGDDALLHCRKGFVSDVWSLQQLPRSDSISSTTQCDRQLRSVQRVVQGFPQQGDDVLLRFVVARRGWCSWRHGTRSHARRPRSCSAPKTSPCPSRSSRQARRSNPRIRERLGWTRYRGPLLLDPPSVPQLILSS